MPTSNLFSYYLRYTYRRFHCFLPGCTSSSASSSFYCDFAFSQQFPARWKLLSYSYLRKKYFLWKWVLAWLVGSGWITLGRGECLRGPRAERGMPMVRKGQRWAGHLFCLQLTGTSAQLSNQSSPPPTPNLQKHPTTEGLVQRRNFFVFGSERENWVSC